MTKQHLGVPSPPSSFHSRPPSTPMVRQGHKPRQNRVTLASPSAGSTAARNHRCSVQTRGTKTSTSLWLERLKVFRNFSDNTFNAVPPSRQNPDRDMVCSCESCQNLFNGCSGFGFSSLFFFLLLIIIFIMAVCDFLGGQWEEVGGFNLTNRPCQLVPLVVSIFKIHRSAVPGGKG